VREAVRYSQQKVSLLNHVDGLAEGMRIIDPSGATLHQNRAFTRILAQERYAERVDLAANELAHELVSLLQSRERGGDEPAIAAKRFVRKVATESSNYELRGTYIGRALFSEDRSIAITLLPLAARADLSDQTLQRRFGLTGRQLEIARRLARGQPNKEIAHACGISLHTVRRHAEKIFAKLGANTRGQIGTKLRGD
jgi:DNA-binding CsgD family transcriptional regulator